MVPEGLKLCYMRSSWKFPQSVMVWVSMSSAAVSPLFFLMSRVIASNHEVLQNFMLPSAEFIFQQNFAPVHTANVRNESRPHIDAS